MYIQEYVERNMDWKELSLIIEFNEEFSDFQYWTTYYIPTRDAKGRLHWRSSGVFPMNTSSDRIEHFVICSDDVNVHEMVEFMRVTLDFQKEKYRLEKLLFEAIGKRITKNPLGQEYLQEILNRQKENDEKMFEALTKYLDEKKNK